MATASTENPTRAELFADRLKLAFRWDALNQTFSRLQPDDPVKIGEAIWVYYPEPSEP